MPIPADALISRTKFTPGPENFSFSRFASLYTAHRRLCDYALYKSTIDTDTDIMQYMISRRSVTDGVSLSVSKSKLVYSSLRQHVSSPTHRDGNVLDLMLTRDSDTPRAQLISDVAVQSVCFSDHHLVTCRLGVPPPPSAVTTSFTYRPLRRIDKQAFCQDILQSRLYGSPQCLTPMNTLICSTLR